MSQEPWNQQHNPHNSGYQQNPYTSANPSSQNQQTHNNAAANQNGYAGAYQTDSPYYTSYNAPYFEEQSKTPKKYAGGVLLGAALIASLIGGGVGAGVVALSQKTSSTITTTNAGTTIVNNTDSVNAITAAVEKAMPSVVTIGVVAPGATGSGSGIILDGEGHILTNTHVVTLDGKVNNPTVEVQLSNGHTVGATVVGTDPTSDLAVIKIDPNGLNLTPATLGNSQKLNVGETTIAIGAPLGLQNTVTDGIISTLSRTIQVASSEAPEETAQEERQRPNLGNQDLPFQFQIPGQDMDGVPAPKKTISLNVLQTDAAINPGNSGGALVNTKGEVIGINVAIASAQSGPSSSSSGGNIGVGFSIPINYAHRIAQEIIKDGVATHGFLGANVSTSPADNDQSEMFGDGAHIEEVVPNSAAAKAGLQKGDVVTMFNGHRITDSTELTASVREAAAGQTVKATIIRNGSSEEKEITLGNAADARKK
ncbi:S1C family serine protease [Rothia sp. CCM 9418]|uniref:S1C family serine protease n=1 Tax=Rothia sp. CCM 9418 TaxID=3402661 RepID=UPI003AEDCEEC